jgi:Tfp pilus assembly protein PilN
MMQLGDNLLRCVITFEFLGLKSSDDQQRRVLEQRTNEYSTAALHLYKLLRVRDEEALARRRWNAVLGQVKWADENDRLHVELKICTRIEALQRELMAHYRLEHEQEDNGPQ